LLQTEINTYFTDKTIWEAIRWTKNSQQ